MLRRLRPPTLVVVLFITAITTAGCQLTESLRVETDGSGSVTWDVEIQRDEWTSQGMEWTALEDFRDRIDDSPDRAATRDAFADFFAIDDRDPILDGLSVDAFELTDDDLRLVVSRPFTDIGGADGLTAIDGFGMVGRLQFVEDDSVYGLASSRDAADDLARELFATDQVVFADFDPDERPDLPTFELATRIDVGGEVLETNAHTRDGNLLGWRWHVGEVSPATSIDVRWDPAGVVDDGCELCVLGMPFVIWIVAGAAAIGLGVLAAAFGLFESIRIWRRDRGERFS